MTKTDTVFLKQFLQIIAGLMAFTLVLIVGAYIAHGRFYNDENRGIGQERAAVRTELASSLIQPVGGLYAGQAGQKALMEAEARALEEIRKNVPYGGSTDGGLIYERLCATCHKGGTGGAPIMTKAAWAPRIAQGEEVLIKHATEGFKGDAGQMPARGGNLAMTDEQVASSVRWMIANLQ